MTAALFGAWTVSRILVTAEAGGERELMVGTTTALVPCRGVELVWSEARWRRTGAPNLGSIRTGYRRDFSFRRSSTAGVD